MRNVEPESNVWAYREFKRLKLCCLIMMTICLSGCSILTIPANIAEFGLVPEADIDEYELATPLRINVQPNIISNHMIVRKDGTLWSMDTNYRKAFSRIPKSLYLGRDSKDFYGQVEFIDDVKEVVAIFDVIVVLKNDGTVWSWGKPDWEVFNKSLNFLGYKSEQESLPRQILGLPSIKFISSSDGTMLAIDQEGSVWRWGQPDYDALKKAEDDVNNAVAYNLPIEDFSLIDTKTPHKVPFLQSIVKASRYGHTFLNKQGEVYKLIHPKFQGVMAPFVEKK